MKDPTTQPRPRSLRIATGLLTLLATAGCATTPEHRIARAPEVFAALPAEHQALVREGRVAPGFSPEAVRLALGEPDRRWIRTDASGRAEIWIYTRFEDTNGRTVFTGFYHRDFMRERFLGDGIALGAAREVDRLRVEFRDGQVSAVEARER